jgi:hypothetical protein
MMNTFDTIDNVEDYIQSLSITELKKLGENVMPLQLNYTQEEMEIAEKIWDIMDLTGLDFESVEKILIAPKQASLKNIAIYCKALDINFFDFTNKAFA